MGMNAEVVGNRENRYTVVTRDYHATTLWNIYASWLRRPFPLA